MAYSVYICSYERYIGTYRIYLGQNEYKENAIKKLKNCFRRYIENVCLHLVWLEYLEGDILNVNLIQIKHFKLLLNTANH